MKWLFGMLTAHNFTYAVSPTGFHRGRQNGVKRSEEQNYFVTSHYSYTLTVTTCWTLGRNLYDEDIKLLVLHSLGLPQSKAITRVSSKRISYNAIDE